MMDRNLLSLTGAKRETAVLLAGGFADALLTVGEALGLSAALSQLWYGQSLASQVGMLALFLCCFAARQLVGAVRQGRIQRFADQTASDLREQLASRIFDSGPSLVQQQGTGALVSTLIEGVDQVRTYVALVLPKTADLLAIPLTLGLALLFIDPISGVICLVVLPVIIFYMQMLGANSKDAAAAQYGKFQRLANHFTDTLRGVSDIHVFGQGETHEQRIFAASERLREATGKTLRSAFTSSLVMDLFRVFALAAVAIMLGFRLLAGDAQLMPALAVLVIVPELFAALRRYSTDFHAGLDGRNQLAAILALLKGAESEKDTEELYGKGTEQANSKGIESHDENLGGTESKGAHSHEERLSLSLRSIGFTYQSNDETHTALTNISLQVEKPCRIGIVGPSGSGKTTLVNILAGFAAPTTGTICALGRERADLSSADWRSRVIYIPQNPHVFYGSIRENVAFYQPDASPAQVEWAIDQAGLRECVSELPDGIHTIVGKGGRTLSGGQAQRLALARAFLCDDRDILILDEPTAHLDIETELELKERMLPLMAGRLVFFATHRLHWLQDMDLVLDLGAGRLTKGGHLVEEGEEEHAAAACKPNCIAGAASATDAADAADAASITPKDPAKTWRDIWRTDTWARPCLKRYSSQLAKSLGLGVLTMVFAVGLMFMSGYVISAAAEMPIVGLFAILVPLGLVQLFGIGKPLLGYCERLASHDWVLHLVSWMRRRLFHEIERDGAFWSARHRAGDALGMLAEDVGHVQDLYLKTVFPLATAAVLWLLASVLYGFVNLGCALFVLVAVGALCIGPAAVSLRRTAARNLRDKQLRDEMYAAAVDDVEGLADWTFSQQRSRYIGRIMDADTRLAESRTQSDHFARWRDCVTQIGFGAIILVICVQVALTFGTADQAAAATGLSSRPADWMAAFVLGFFPLLESFLPLSDAVVAAGSHMDSLRRLNEVSAEEKRSGAKPNTKADAAEDATLEAAAAATPQDASLGAAVPAMPAMPTTPKGATPEDTKLGEIQLECVSFAYPESNELLQNVSLNIQQGQHLALLGRSGQGKTTLLQLIRGNLQPTAGRVLVGGQSAAEFESAGQMCELVGVISQESYLFNDTLLENLTLGDQSISRNQCAEALEQVGLGKVLHRLPHGLDTRVDEAGLRFSGGERHRIALARVLLRDMPVVLLDEPTVSLDPHTEQELLQTMLELLHGRTVLLCTHHLAGVELTDRVLFLENGHFVIDGSPAELAKSCERYRLLLAFDQQAATP